MNDFHSGEIGYSGNQLLFVRFTTCIDRDVTNDAFTAWFDDINGANVTSTISDTLDQARKYSRFVSLPNSERDSISGI